MATFMETRCDKYDMYHKKCTSVLKVGTLKAIFK